METAFSTKGFGLIIFPSLRKDIGVDALTVFSLGLWIYKTQSHTCVNVGEIYKTGYLSSINQESCTQSGILGF